MGNCITLLSRFTPHSRLWRRLWVSEAMESAIRFSRRLHVMDAMESCIPNKFENYDVFLSHRGPDTKSGFVDFLYKDLKRVGLQPFLDCRCIGIGEDTWECINHAIKTTPIALVIFSESFAQSEWCLKELHVMLDTPSIEVLPIFYNVQPWEVKFPEKGKLKDGFKKLKQRHDKTVIEQWRAVLKKASKIVGWIHPGAPKRLEGDLVTEVVGEVFELANKPLPLHVGDHVVGVKQVAEEIIQTLHVKKKVLMLGLWGMGGIGKSTLARELYNQLGKRFAASCYIEDVTEKVIQGGVVRVQNCILNDLCMNGLKQIEDKSKGKIILEERLCKKQILLVLDDVRDNDEMNYWITSKMLMEGSMCIVTSRDRRVFEKSNSFDINYEIYIHDVQLLNCKNSKQVFTSFAFGSDCKVEQEFEWLVAKISKACGGVPLVLKVCGALLKEEKNVDIWEEVMNKLNFGTIMDEKKIFECLRISYDALEHQHQEMFLDIACALLGQSVDLAKQVWKSHGWSSALCVRNLIEKALIFVDDQGCFNMHDHMRDMGRQIERKRRASEGVWRRLWMPESLTSIKEDERLPDSLQTLIISNDPDFKHRQVDLDLSHMKELRVLICTDTINVMLLLPKNLRWFKWHAAGYQYFKGEWICPKIPQNSKLMILNLQCLRIKSLSESFGELSNLEVLNLCGNSKLNMLPDSFGCLIKLKKLYLTYSEINTLPESFGKLRNLEMLDLKGSLELNMLPDSFGGLIKLKELHLASSRMNTLPESFGELSNLEVLNLKNSKLNTLPDWFGGLKELRDLTLEYSEIESLPESFGELNSLEMLNMSYCFKLIMLPDSFGTLIHLRNLKIVHPSSMERLPKSFGELSNLEVLDLSKSLKLNTLPNLFGGLKNLRDLNLEQSGIKSIPKSFGELNNLKVLNLSRCQQLITLPDLFGSLRNLKHLDLKFSRMIVSLPASFGQLSSLEELILWHCEKLIRLPDSFGRLRNLKTLKLGGSGLESLPESFGELSNLQDLNLSWCTSLRALSQSFTQLTTLEKLNLSSCPASQSFESLQHLMSGNCEVTYSSAWLSWE